MSGEKRECVGVLCRYLGPLGRQLASDVQFYFTVMGAFGGTGCLSLSFALSCTRGWTCSVWGLEKPSHYFKIVLNMQLILLMGFVGTPASTSSSCTCKLT